MKRSLVIGNLFGVPVQIQPSLLLICLPIAFATSFGEQYVNPQASHSPFWMLGLIGALLYCASIYLHELGHFIALHHYGIRVESITLNAFGGRTRASGTVPSATIDLVVSLAGPACTLALTGLGFGLMSVLGGHLTLFTKDIAVTLAILNLSILPGCLIPVWPTDMYRALRAVAWKLSGSFPVATQAACGLSLAVIAVAIVAGVLTLVLPVPSQVARLGVYSLLAGLIFLIQGRGIISTMRQSLAPVPANQPAQPSRQRADRRAA